MEDVEIAPASAAGVKTETCRGIADVADEIEREDTAEIRSFNAATSPITIVAADIARRRTKRAGDALWNSNVKTRINA